MKYLPAIAGAVLGLLFVVFGLNFFLNFIPMPPGPPEGSPAALFMGALFPTGYLGFIKSLEILGGVMVAVPRTRNLGLLVLGPILVNIVCYHIFLMRGVGLFSPPLVVIGALAAYLLWVGRRPFSRLLGPPA